MSVEDLPSDGLEEDVLESIDSQVSVDHELGLVSVTSKGPVVLSRATEGARAGRRLAMKLGYKVLFDISGAQVSLSLADAYFLVRDPKVRRTGFEDVAIVSPTLEGADWVHFLELTSANTGVLLRLFPDREAAVSALLEPEREAESPVPHTDKVVLVVDDDPDVLALTSTVIRRAGYQVQEAGSGEEALRVASELRPDLILLDVVMPDLDGIEVCRRLKTDPVLGESIVALASGVRTDLEDQRESLASHPDAYIPRPMNNKDLLASIEFLFKKQRMEGNS